MKPLLGILLLLSSGFGWSSPQIQSWHTDAGARVLFVEAPELPMLDIQLVFDAGTARDGNQPGLALLTNAVLTDAGGPWDSDQVAEQLESVGAQLGAGVQRDMAWVSLRSLTDERPLNLGLDTLRALLSEPRFDARDIERTRQSMLVSLRRVEQSPGSIASRAFWRTLYADHPYASFKYGNELSLGGITRQDLISHYQRYYNANNAVVAIVGALRREQAEQIADQLTRGLPAGEKAALLPQVSDLKAPQLEQIPYASSQSHVLSGQPGVYRGDPDYFPLYVGNHILGGSGLVSRLSDEVREKRGLSYSVYSYFSPMRRHGPFLMGAQTENSRVPETLRVLRQTLSDFIEQGPGDEELQAAKQNITGGFPLKIASNEDIVTYLAVMGFYDMPLDYLETFVSRIQAVTREQIQDAFKRRLNPDNFVTVVVGNGQAITQQ